MTAAAASAGKREIIIKLIKMEIKNSDIKIYLINWWWTNQIHIYTDIGVKTFELKFTHSIISKLEKRTFFCLWNVEHHKSIYEEKKK